MRISLVHLLLNQAERPHSPPLGPLYLVSVLRGAGYDVAFRQFAHIRGTPLRIDDLVDFLDRDTEVLALSSMINALPLLLAALPHLRRRRPELRIVAGGAGYNGIAGELVDSAPCFAAVAGGEGEAMVVPLMRALERRNGVQEVPGIWFSGPRGVRATPPPKRIDDLDRLPYPAFDTVNFDDYQNVPLIASRGCPFHCSFCDVAPAWGRLHRRRSVEHVVAEMEWLRRERGVSRLAIVDDIFVIDRHWVREFCRTLIRSSLDVSWRCTAHINLMDDDLLPLLRDAGCERVFFGIESGADEVLRKIRKNFDVERVLDAVERTTQHVGVDANLIWGFPGETPDQLERTLALRRRLMELGVNPSLVFLAPLASASLYRESPAPMVFEPQGPNIFYADYDELDEEDRQEIESLIRSRPRLFCAFHQYESPHQERLEDRIRFELATDGLLQGAPPWELV